MPVHRKRFRIEEIQDGGAAALVSATDDDTATTPVHREIIAELRAIHEQMGAPHRSASSEAATASEVESTNRAVADAKALLQTYRAQIEQCEKLKVELDLIYDAISRTKQEIAVLHGKSFGGHEMAKVTDELDAVVGGTEQATQHILEAAESIDQSAGAMSKATSPEQVQLLGEEIQERVISIFEACNFQDLTGQRISKVMTTMKFIEHHINVMMDIWGGVDAIRAHAPPIIDDRVGDAKLLNGPKLDGDEGHVSQDDIDALFG
jgi:chemotaxis protein CheZ